MKCLIMVWDQQHGERTEEIYVEFAKERVQERLSVDQKEAERLMRESCETNTGITLPETQTNLEEILFCEPDDLFDAGEPDELVDAHPVST